MYHLLVNGVLKAKGDKAEISGHIAHLIMEDDYKVMTDCTDEFPTPQDHRLAEQRNVTINSIGEKIDFSKHDFEMPSEMQDRLNRWNRLVREQTQFEIACGY